MAEMEEETVKESIKKLGEKFKHNPLDFTVETSIVAELQEIMKRKIESEEIEIKARYDDFNKNSEHEADYTNYKERYLKRICNQDEISKVQIEVNIGKKGKNRLLDLAVLNDDTKIYLINGTKYFDKESIEHAVEVKFVKNKNIAPTTLEELNENNDSLDENNFLEGDLKKMKELDKAISKHLVIFSNKNIFQKEVDGESKDGVNHERFTKEAHRRIDALVDYCDDENIDVYHYFPRTE